MRKTAAQKKADLVMEQVKWIQECGGTVDGYRAKYTVGVQADDIYKADMEYLKRLVEYAAGVRKDLFGESLSRIAAGLAQR